MVSAINNAPAGYIPLSFEKARAVLLDECVRDVEKDLTPIKDTWYSQGVSIVSNGWSNVKHKPLINVIAVNSRGAMQRVPNNVLQVVTDNVANCKAAGKEIEKVYKHLFWSPCSLHTLELIFKDLANEFAFLMDTYKKGKSIVKYFLNHIHALAIFRENSKLELLKVAKTRFASHYILLKRLMDCREALCTTVALNSWREWVKHGDENTRNVGQKVTDTIKSKTFWDDVESIIAITKPIYLLIKFCDGEGPKMGEIYERINNMLGEIENVMKENQYACFFPQVNIIVLARWEKMTIPLHCLGFALTPRFYDKEYLQKLAPNGVQRRPPNLDEEVVLGVMQAFNKVAQNMEEETKLQEQFAKFHMKKGLFALLSAQMDAITMESIKWWSTYGAGTPELAELAKKVLSQPISSSSAERNWSTYSYIHNVKRNRLNVTRVDKLVFIHSKLQIKCTTKMGHEPREYLLGRFELEIRRYAMKKLG